MTDWYIYQVNGNHVGPVPTDLLVRGIVAGKVPRDSHITSPGDIQWHQLLTVPEVTQALGDLERSGLPVPPRPLASVPPAGPPAADAAPPIPLGTPRPAARAPAPMPPQATAPVAPAPPAPPVPPVPPVPLGQQTQLGLPPPSQRRSQPRCIRIHRRRKWPRNNHVCRCHRNRHRHRSRNNRPFRCNPLPRCSRSRQLGTHL